ncbi:MAG: hypothetical protein VB088_15820 [Sphaerochaeta sp.]|uniref:ABC-2 type transporter domain-containing protein n=1 Tax=bioreactor metagenome TaxID=1076179 RepID=A0A644WBI0_9ZZZZ|nr:hypothetical protein [Sphaerochaeta sp.]
MQSEERWKSIKVLAKHFLKTHLNRIDIWILASACLLVFSIYALNTIRTIHKDMFIISDGIYIMPTFLITCLLSMFISLLSIMKVSKDFDSRIYETYLYGPVDDLCYLTSVVITYTLINFGITFVLPLVWLFLLYFLTGIPVTGIAIMELLLGMSVVETMFLLGLVFVAKSEKERNSLWIVLILQFFLIGIIFAHMVVSTYLIPLKRTDIDVFKFFRDVFSFLFTSSRYISPYTSMFLIQATGQSGSRMGLSFLGILMIVDIVLFILARKLLSRKLV